MISEARPGHGVVGLRVIDLSEWHDAILTILVGGWVRAAVCPERHRNSDEVSITECLRRGMREELKERNDEWCRRVTILPGTESHSIASALKPDGLTDISVFLQDIRERYDEHDPHAIIECKRVTEHNAALCRLYVSEGIDRFGIGKYAIRHKAGFMVGYVISGGVLGVVKRINRRLSREKRQTESLQPSSIVQTAWAWVSRHPRPKPSMAIELHHAFFVFSP